MTNQMIQELAKKMPLSMGTSPCQCCDLGHDAAPCTCMDSFPLFEDDEVIEQCDLGDTTCEACN